MNGVKFYIITALCVFMVCPFTTHAQSQSGYSNITPDITVDRSVLEDLKGYTPPPMFGAPSADITVELQPPLLTAPRPEDLLNHPSKNGRVYTAPPKKEAPPKQVTRKEQPKKSNPIAKKPAKEITKKSAYKPKAKQSMPAIPSGKVEKNELPPMPGMPIPSLPPLEKSDNSTKRPSPGLRMMDAALENQLIDDEEQIRTQLMEGATKDSKKSKPATKKTPANKTLTFKVSETNLAPSHKRKIIQTILPELRKNKTARIQILSFASSPDNTESTARRISLARALAIRDNLKDHGINTSRIDVRALSSEKLAKSPNKVDIIFLN